MEEEACLESLSFQVLDLRSHRGTYTWKKRFNKKEKRIRETKGEARRPMSPDSDEAESEEDGTETANAKALRKAENRKLFEDAMLKEALGEKPKDDDRKMRLYTQRLDAYTTFPGPTPAQFLEATEQRAALLRTLITQLV
jgi:hypothetical protein